MTIIKKKQYCGLQRFQDHNPELEYFRCSNAETYFRRMVVHPFKTTQKTCRKRDIESFLAEHSDLIP